MRMLVATALRRMAGGAEKYLQVAFPEFLRRGWDVALLTDLSKPVGRTTIDPPDAKIPAWSLDETSAKRALDEIGRWAPDIVFDNGILDLDVEASLRNRYPTAIFAHNYIGACATGTKRHATPTPRPCERTLGYGCLPRLYPNRCGGLNPRTLLTGFSRAMRRRSSVLACDHVVTASRPMREEYLRLGVAPDKVTVAAYPVTGIELDPEPRFDRPSTGRVALLARLTDLKGGRLAVAALAEASARLGRTLTLVVAGDGPEREAIRQSGERLGVPIEFLGWIDGQQRLRTLAEADVVTVPSIWPEPFGLTGIEAGCRAVPSVAFAVGGIPDWLEAGVTGELAPGDPPTVRGLAEAFERALRDPSHLARIRRGAWEASQRYTVESHFAVLESVLRKVVEKTAGSRTLARR